MIEFIEGLSPSLKASLIVIGALMVISVLIGRRIEKLDPTRPVKSPVVYMILAVGALNNFIKEFYGKNWRLFAPVLFAVLLYLVAANTSSLLGLQPPLANMSVAVSFSIFAFVTIQASAIIIRKPKRRLKDLSSPSVLLFPVNLISEFSVPFAMGLRLFGNLLSGAVIATIVANLLGILGGWLSHIIVVHPIFNIGFGLIQAFVYFMLLTIFLAMAVETEEEAA